MTAAQLRAERRSRSLAIALFAVAYLGTLAITLAPQGWLTTLPAAQSTAPGN